MTNRNPLILGKLSSVTFIPEGSSEPITVPYQRLYKTLYKGRLCFVVPEDIYGTAYYLPIIGIPGITSLLEKNGIFPIT